jgi:hypothetical protein
MAEAVSDLPASMVVECPGCCGAVATRSDIPFRAARCPLCGGEFLIPRPRGDEAAAVPAPAPVPSTPLGSPEDLGSDEPPSFSRPQPRGDLEFAEPAKTIETAEGPKMLRRLSPEEKQARRARRNMIMLAGGAMILFVLVYLLRGEPPRR